MYRANSANDVFAATPEIPEIDRCPPCSPLMNEKSTGTGWPDWSKPIGRPRPRISSTNSAASRSAPSARRTAAPGSGATQRSGMVRRTCTSTARTV